MTDGDVRYAAHNNRETLGIEDRIRANNMLCAAKGRRLTYRRPYRIFEHQEEEPLFL